MNLHRNYKKITENVKNEVNVQANVKTVSKYLYEDKEYIGKVEKLFDFCCANVMKEWEKTFIYGLKKKVDERIELSISQKERVREMTIKYVH